MSPRAAESRTAPRYRLHGLVVESDLPLDAPAVEADADYRLRLAEPRRASGPPPGELLGELHFGGWSYWCAETPGQADIWLMRYLDVADIELDRRRRELRVFPVPGQDVGLISALIGSGVLALILSADCEMVVHASAVELEGRVLAIAGASGSGKTTLAALLCADGARLVADDALRILPAQACRCYLGTDTLRLRSAAAELAEAIPGVDSVATADGRTGASPSRPPEDAALHISALLFPCPSHDVQTLRVERLSTKEGLIELVRNPRVVSWRDAERLAAYFDHASRLAAAVPIYRATVPWGPPFPLGLAAEITAAVGLRDPVSVGR